MMKQWFGWGSKPVAIGVEFEDDAVRVAMLRDDPVRIVGLGAATYPVGTVVGGHVRSPREAGSSLGDLLDALHWSTRPVVTLAVAAMAHDPRRAEVSAPIEPDAPFGRVRSGVPLVDSAMAAVTLSGLETTRVDVSPVAVARFCLLARGDAPLFFARGHGGRHRWTLCHSVSSLEIECESDPQPGPVEIGDDLATLSPPEWTGLAITDTVRTAVPHPERHVVAVGAALAGFGRPPEIDLLGPNAERSASLASTTTWTLEQIR